MRKKETPPAPLNIPHHRDTTWFNRRLGGTLLLSEADTAFLSSMRPRCAKCNRLVEFISWAMLSGRRIRFTVMCHGATEVMDIGFDDLPSLMVGGVHGGIAFTEKPMLRDERTE